MQEQKQTAGGVSIAGAWVLDLSRSDTLQGYLQSLGTPQETIQAQVVAERAYPSRNVIALDESKLVIHKDTAVHHFTEEFELGREKVTASSSGRGSNHATAYLQDGVRHDGYVLVTHTAAPSGERTLETVESRQLIDGGRAHIQQISVHKIRTGKQGTVRRIWARVPMTQDDQIRLLC